MTDAVSGSLGMSVAMVVKCGGSGESGRRQGGSG
jgi:hypothetical protein